MSSQTDDRYSGSRLASFLADIGKFATAATDDNNNPSTRAAVRGGLFELVSVTLAQNKVAATVGAVAVLAFTAVVTALAAPTALAALTIAVGAYAVGYLATKLAEQAEIGVTQDNTFTASDLSATISSANISFSTAKAFAELQGFPISDKAKTKEDILDELFDYENDFPAPQKDPSNPENAGVIYDEHEEEQTGGYDSESQETNQQAEEDFVSGWEEAENNIGGSDGGGSDGGGSGKPIILDLDGDGVELVDLDDSTAFYDIDGDGYRERMGWAAADDGFLAYDKDGDGIISAHDELSFVSYVEGARTDLEGLAHFDTNGNGRLDPGDAEWGKFRVWQDLDQDGESDPGELRTLSEAGIESIALTSDGVERTVANNEVFGEGTYTHSDGERSFLDAALRHSAYGFREDADGNVTVGSGGDAVLHVAGPTTEAVRSLDAAALGVAGIVGHDTVDHLTAARARPRAGGRARPTSCHAALQEHRRARPLLRGVGSTQPEHGGDGSARRRRHRGRPREARRFRPYQRGGGAQHAAVSRRSRRAARQGCLVQAGGLAGRHWKAHRSRLASARANHRGLSYRAILRALEGPRRGISMRRSGVREHSLSGTR